MPFTSADANMLLLMRHRGVLLGIVGGLLLAVCHSFAALCFPVLLVVLNAYASLLVAHLWSVDTRSRNYWQLHVS